ncbi:MAG: hypothetical protein U0N62_01140, partial [Hydrogeniiclostridium sp.]
MRAMMQLALTFNDIFKSSFLEQVDSFAPLDMVIALALAFALGLFILLIYRKTFSGVMYSASFGLSLMALTLITTLVIMAVTSNVVLSLGMVGALSIVRFRAAGCKHNLFRRAAQHAGQCFSRLGHFPFR